MVPQKLTNRKGTARDGFCLCYSKLCLRAILLLPPHSGLCVSSPACFETTHYFLLPLPAFSFKLSRPHLCFYPFSREAPTPRSRFSPYFPQPPKASHLRIFHSRATHRQSLSMKWAYKLSWCRHAR